MHTTTYYWKNTHNILIYHLLLHKTTKTPNNLIQNRSKINSMKSNLYVELYEYNLNKLSIKNMNLKENYFWQKKNLNY